VVELAARLRRIRSRELHFGFNRSTPAEQYLWRDRVNYLVLGGTWINWVRALEIGYLIGVGLGSGVYWIRAFESFGFNCIL